MHRLAWLSDVNEPAASGVSVTKPVRGSNVVAGDVVNFDNSNVFKNTKNIIGKTNLSSTTFSALSSGKDLKVISCGGNLFFVAFVNTSGDCYVYIFEYSENKSNIESNGNVTTRADVLVDTPRTARDARILSCDALSPSGSVEPGLNDRYLYVGLSYCDGDYSSCWFIRIDKTNKTLSKTKLRDSSKYLANYNGDFSFISLPENRMCILHEDNNDNYIYDLYNINYSSVSASLTSSEIILPSQTTKFYDKIDAFYHARTKQLILLINYSTRDDNAQNYAVSYDLSNPQAPKYINRVTIYTPYNCQTYRREGSLIEDSSGRVWVPAAGRPYGTSAYIYGVTPVAGAAPSVTYKSLSHSSSITTRSILCRFGEYVLWLGGNVLVRLERNMDSYATIKTNPGPIANDRFGELVVLERGVSNPGIMIMGYENNRGTVMYSVATFNGTTLVASKYSTNSSTMAIALNSANAGQECTALADGYGRLSGVARGRVITPDVAVEQDVYAYSPANGYISVIGRKYRPK